MRTMSSRIRLVLQLGGLSLLALPIAATALVIQPQPGPFVGPNNPPLVDSPGLGFPSPTDAAISLTRAMDTVTIGSPWNCSNQKNTFMLGAKNGNGVFTQVTRSTGGSPVRSQVVTITGFNTQGEPTGFLFQDFIGGTLNQSGNATLISSHNNGIYDTLELSGGSLNMNVTFIYFPNGEGVPNFISIPWSQAELLGAKSACDGSGDPQVFVPLTANGRIGFDLDGNGAPDPDLFQSPVLAPRQVSVAQVPALGAFGVALLAGGLLVAGLRFLRRASSLPAV
jgi:hypothetical protein